MEFRTLLLELKRGCLSILLFHVLEHFGADYTRFGKNNANIKERSKIVEISSRLIENVLLLYPFIHIIFSANLIDW